MYTILGSSSDEFAVFPQKNSGHIIFHQPGTCGKTIFCFQNDHLIFVWRRCADVIDKQGDSGKNMPKQKCCKSKCIQPIH